MSVRLPLSVLCALPLLAAGCRDEKPAPPLSSLTPAPLPRLPGGAAPAPDAGAEPGREAAYQVAPAALFGEPLPAGAARVELQGGEARLGGQAHRVEDPTQRARLLAAAGGRVLLVPDAETYLAQAAPLLAALEDGKVETWLAHPSGRVAFRLTLRDEPEFNAWLEQPVPGKVRIVQRADGLELVTNLGKVPGGDPNGPSLPLRGGQLDVAAARAGLEKVQKRFEAPDLCVLPSFGTELAQVAEVLSATFRAAGEGIFPERCLVYPRPRK
jgi:hypothetical protein